MKRANDAPIRVKVLGVGGAGGNAVTRMAGTRLDSLEFLAVNTDAQSLGRIKKVPTLPIGPSTTGGLGSGGDSELGRKAIKESYRQVAELLEGVDLVFITVGLGGGTGTGAAPVIAEMAKRLGALTVAVVTLPFSFEGTHRREIAGQGLAQLLQRVDTLITVENDRLISSLDGKLSLDKAFKLADEVLRQGVQGISEIITLPGLVNVDFADVKAVMSDAGMSYMATGEGKGSSAAEQAIDAALSNPFFDAPLKGARGILFNIKGGKDLTLGHVNHVAGIVREASQSDTQVIFGVVQDKKWNKKVHITLVATGVKSRQPVPAEAAPHKDSPPLSHRPPHNPIIKPTTNGRRVTASAGIHKFS